MKCVESLSFFLFAQLIAGRAVVEVVFGGADLRQTCLYQPAPCAKHTYVYTYVYVCICLAYPLDGQACGLLLSRSGLVAELGLVLGAVVELAALVRLGQAGGLDGDVDVADGPLEPLAG